LHAHRIDACHDPFLAVSGSRRTTRDDGSVERSSARAKAATFNPADGSPGRPEEPPASARSRYRLIRSPHHPITLAPWHPGTLAPWHPGTLAPRPCQPVTTRGVHLSENGEPA